MNNKFLLISTLFFLLSFQVNAQYCSISGDSSNEWIASITMDGERFSSGNNGGYENFTDKTIAVVSGENVNFRLVPGFSEPSDPFDEYWRIWIDWDTDGNFETNELVFDAGDGNTDAVTGNFTVPNDFSGSTRMRIAMKWVGTYSDGTSDISPPNPCQNFDFGEVEDYTISTGQSSNDVYCTHSGGDTVEEWIAQVKIGDFQNNSGNDDGYDFVQTPEINLQKGNNIAFTLTPGYNDVNNPADEYWRIWLDVNQNENFESGEILFDSQNGVTGTINNTFTIPSSALLGKTRMRIAMKWVGNFSDGTSDLSPPNACGSFTYGEVEDYIVNISEGSSNNDPYCVINADASGEWIASIKLGTFSNSSGSNGGYGDFTNQNIPVNRGQSYSLEMSPGFVDVSNPFEEYWRVWADWNNNQTFESNELIFDSNGAKVGTVVGNITIPSGATLGNVRLRIAMKWVGTFSDGTSDLAPPEACNSFDLGEIEDYTLQISQSSGNLPPVAAFSAPITTGQAPLTINFQDQSTNNPTAWNWTFDGGTPSSSNLQNPTITYTTPGTYSVSLVASNASGTNSVTKTTYISVLENNSNAAPIANFNSNTTSGEAPLNVLFYDLSSNNPTAWNWTFEGGNPATSTIQNPSVNYTTPGTYTVSLTATNSNGSNVITKAAYITVVQTTGQLPQAQFSANSVTGNAPLSVQFSDLSTNNPTSWEWQFLGGNPESATEQHPIVVYNTPGTYPVSLTVSNATGSNTTTLPNYITVLGSGSNTAPIAAFTASIFEGPAPLVVTFTNLTNNATAYEWEFPGAVPATSNEPNPSVTYNNPGMFTVKLSTSNEFGSDTKTQLNYINVFTSVGNDNLTIKDNIVIYPNPATDYLHIKTSAETPLQQCKLFNLMGKEVLSTYPTQLSNTSFHLTTKQFPSGMYLLSLKIKEQWIQTKIVIK